MSPPKLEERRRSIEHDPKIWGTFNIIPLPPSNKKSTITQIFQYRSLPEDIVSDPSPKFVDTVFMNDHVAVDV